MTYGFTISAAFSLPPADEVAMVLPETSQSTQESRDRPRSRQQALWVPSPPFALYFPRP